MRPTVSTDRYDLYLGDCREILPTLAAGSVDAVVTDPPFGIDWARASWADESDSYPAMMREIVSHGNRIVETGWCFYFQAMLNAPRFHEWFDTNWRIFAACKNFAQIRPTGVWHSWDPVVFWRNGPNSPPNSRLVNRDYFVGNVAGVFGEQAEHPCPRPLDTMTHIVNLAAPHGGLVIDPFMGSGTTGVACMKLGRRFIGIEIEPRYFEIAERRIREAANTLWTPVEKAETEPMFAGMEALK